MILTSRDLTLFQNLRDYGLLTTRQLAQVHFPDVALTTVLRRLRKLEDGAYIQRLRGSESYEFAWALNDKGAHAIGAQSYKRIFRRDCMDHELKLLSLRLSLEGSGIARSWIPEHDIRSQMARRYGIKELSNRLIPDGLMGIETHGFKESVAIELELHFKNQRRYERTFRDYSRKQNVAFVWYVVSQETLGRHLEKIWKQTVYPGASIKFVWSCLSEVLTDPRRAKLNGIKGGQSIEAAWDAPAHPSAHEVSTQATSETSGKLKATTEDQKKTLVLAS